MTEDNNDKEVNDLFKRLEKAIGKSLNGLFESLNPESSDKDLMDDFLVKTFDEKKKKVAKDFSSIEIAVVMLLSGYLIDPKLRDHSSFAMMSAISSHKGIQAFTQDMRENGIEASFDQVAEALDNVMSFIVEFGLASVNHGLMIADVDCAPPKSRNRQFEDLGIEDPFKDSPEA